MKRFDNSYIILLLYVDDMLITGANMEEIDKFKRVFYEGFGSCKANPWNEDF